MIQLLQALREHTQDIHQSLHVHPLLSSLTQAHLTFYDYYYALRAFECFYQNAESTIKVNVNEHIPNSPVCEWLKTDLLIAKLNPITLDQQINFMNIDTESKLIGYLYVKQGSTLGGQVISKNLLKTLGLHPIKDQRYFAAYGSENGSKWRAFMEYLKLQEKNLILDEVLTSAIHAFNCMTSICTKVLEIKYANIR